MTLYLSRLTVNREAGNAALIPLLDPSDRGKAMDANHRLLWTLFGDTPDRNRDFLWRAAGRGLFFTLSRRPPASHPLFLPPETKLLELNLSPGDKLVFVLRANATKDRAAVSRLRPGSRNGKSRRVDLVMDLLHDMPSGERAAARAGLAHRAAEEWLSRQGELSGFALDGLTKADYTAVPLPRQKGPRTGQAQLGVLDLAGQISVTEPTTFVCRLGQGFGRAKAFGCGMMLIRRT
jgi:CRISPR system Cascade subunit CasE